MATSDPRDVSMEEFRLMAERSGLGMTEEELEQLKPLYDLNLEHLHLLHSADLRPEEMEVTFQPEWPEMEP